MTRDPLNPIAQNLREVSTAPILSGAQTAPPSGSALIWGYGFAAIGTILFSMKAIFVKLAYLPSAGLERGELEPITLLALRMGFSLPVYILIAIIVVRRRRRRGAELPTGSMIAAAMGAGCIGYYTCSFLDFTGLQYITAQLERLLLFTYPGFVVILGALFFGARVTRASLACIALAYSGLAVIFIGGDIATGSNVALGSALLIACAILFALFQLIAKPIISKMGSPLFTCISMGAAACGVFVHFIVNSGGASGVSAALDLPPRIFALGAAIALFSTLLASFAVNVALGRIGAQATATIGMLSPIATVLAAVTLLGEPFGIVDGLGTAITIFGIGLYTYLDKRAARSRPSS